MDIITIDTRRLSLFDMTRFQSVISAERVKKAINYRRDEDRRTCICAEGALRIYLGEKLGIDPAALEIKIAPSGKPYLPGEGDAVPQFNYSHSGPFVLIGVDPARGIGVDIEQMKKAPFDICRKFCTPAEREYVGEDSARFFEVWTLKEAYLKATGEGLSGGLLSVEFTFPDGKPVCSDKNTVCRTIRDKDGQYIAAAIIRLPPHSKNNGFD